MMRIVFVVAAIVLTATVNAQVDAPPVCLTDTVGSKEGKFRIAAESVIIAFSKGDSATLNKFIHPKLGIYYLERIGIYDRVEHDSTIEHGYAGSLTYDGFIGVKHKPLVSAALPDYECGPEKWTKQGTFADTTQSDTLMSFTAKWAHKHRVQVFSREEIALYEYIESQSRKIVVTVVTGRSLVFSLSYLAGEWWLMIMDFVSDDCSA